MKEIDYMKRIFMVVAIALPIVLSMAGAPSAMAAPAHTSVPAKTSPSNCPAGSPPYITWSSFYATDFVLSNDGWKTTNNAPVLTFKWLNQDNQCLFDYQVSDGNWIEQFWLVGNGTECMEDPGWKYNAGIDQYNCSNNYQLNEQWEEYNYTNLCGFSTSNQWALRNDGNDQYAWYNAQNSQALLRDYDGQTTRECWW
jgi:hypothetical protein